MILKAILITGTMLLLSGCSVQFPLADHAPGLSNPPSDTAQVPAGESSPERPIGNAPALPD